MFLTFLLTTLFKLELCYAAAADCSVRSSHCNFFSSNIHDEHVVFSLSRPKNRAASLSTMRADRLATKNALHVCSSKHKAEHTRGLASLLQPTQSHGRKRTAHVQTVVSRRTVSHRPPKHATQRAACWANWIFRDQLSQSASTFSNVSPFWLIFGHVTFEHQVFSIHAVFAFIK